MNRLSFPLLTSLLALLAAPGAVSNPAAGNHPAPAQGAQAPQAREDVIARVGAQVITFGEVNTILNSSAVVGVSIPALGTPERDTARITVLDKLIGANLTYLDAMKQGLDKDPEYLKDVERFEKGILAGLYRQRQMAGEIPVSAQEIQDYVTAQVAAGTEITDDMRIGIEAKIRRQKLKEKLTASGAQLRDGVDVVLYTNNLAASGDAGRADDTPVAEIDGRRIPWGEVKDAIVSAGKGAVMADPLAMEGDARIAALERQIDLRLMTEMAKAAGLQKDPVYRARIREYLKSRLVNLHRQRMIAAMEPSKEDLAAYFEGNRARFTQPETRKVQMVVVKTQAEAQGLKARIQAGEMTIYQAARNHSIAARAKQDLGEVGWVSRGATVPALDEAIFAVGPGEVGGPVETPAGWHLVMVQDVQEAKYEDFDDPVTQKLARREYLNDKLSAYEVDLRKGGFPVEVYQDLLVRLAQQEATAVAQLAEKAKEPGSVTEQRLHELQKLMKP